MFLKDVNTKTHKKGRTSSRCTSQSAVLCHFVFIQLIFKDKRGTAPC